MKKLASSLMLAFTLAGCIGGTAYAEKPEWAGNKHKQHKQKYADNLHFSDESRRIVYDYYGSQQRSGFCPPGLAKKNNGCMPPGQAKKWQRGEPLPSDLPYHDLPRDILSKLPPLPANHRYVQIAQDILIIANGSRRVLDAVEDIMR